MQNNNSTIKTAIFIGAVIIMAISPIGISVTHAHDISIAELLECTNKIRVEYGKSPVSINEKLNSAARAKLHDMKEYNYWAHNNPYTKQKPWDFVDNAGYYFETVGENLATGFTEAQEVCDAWRNSSAHLTTLTNKAFLEVGFATEEASIDGTGEGANLVVQMLGSSNKIYDQPANANFLFASIAQGDKAKNSEKVLIILIVALTLCALLYVILSGEKKSKLTYYLSFSAVIAISILAFLIIC